VGGSKTGKNRIPEDSFLSCVFQRNFHRNVVLEGVAEIPVFGHCHRISQEFLWAGIPVFTPHSSGFLRIPVPAKSCLA
jgi:hypothetical protein